MITATEFKSRIVAVNDRPPPLGGDWFELGIDC